MEEGPGKDLHRFSDVLLKIPHVFAVFVEQAVAWSGHWAPRQGGGVEEGVLVEHSEWGCSLDVRER